MITIFNTQRRIRTESRERKRKNEEPHMEKQSVKKPKASHQGTEFTGFTKVWVPLASAATSIRILNSKFVWRDAICKTRATLRGSLCLCENFFPFSRISK